MRLRAKTSSPPVADVLADHPAFQNMVETIGDTDAWVARRKASQTDRWLDESRALAYKPAYYQPHGVRYL